jgi:hypothetical protein
MDWRKSSYSGGQGDCVEIAWRKSSYSGHEGDCVEIGWPADTADVAVRDSKCPAGSALSFPVDAWRAFVDR